MLEAMKANQDKIMVIATGDKAPDSKVALYIMKKFGLDKVLVETPSYMHYLVSQKMMDELFFNYSCIYVGGQALTIGNTGRIWFQGPSAYKDAEHPFPQRPFLLFQA